jgi:phosphoribosyl 1,2-cyclic phosphodiesterase
MLVRFWGVRGSVAWATAGSIGHGCNTPCVEVSDARTNSVIVLDAGSGIVGLGHALGNDARGIPILLTHFHWDHTQGLPFFEPLYKKGWKPEIWAPRLRNIDVAWVETIFDSPFYPVPYHALPARPNLRLVPEHELELGGFLVRGMMLNHPGGSSAYRIVGEKGDLVYATDHEFGDEAIDRALGIFAHGARVMIMDAHFTPEELSVHKGWGHSSWHQCAEFAARHHVGDLRLFHHKPGRGDVEMHAIVNEARRIFPNTHAAREGDSIDV